MEGLYEKIYEVYDESLFAGPWNGERRIERSILKWSEEAFPEWFEESEGMALNVETYIREEEGTDEIDGFFEFMSPGLCLEAIEIIRDDLEENFEESAAALDLIPILNDLLDKMPF